MGGIENLANIGRLHTPRAEDVQSCAEGGVLYLRENTLPGGCVLGFRDEPLRQILTEPLETRKDIKTIKGEQEARSPNDKRRGPTPRFPEMVDEAIALLEQWGNNGSGSEPKVSSAAQTIFNKWKNNKSKKNKRYDNLKSFTEIVRRSWKRKKPSIGC